MWLKQKHTDFYIHTVGENYDYWWKFLYFCIFWNFCISENLGDKADNILSLLALVGIGILYMAERGSKIILELVK